MYMFLLSFVFLIPCYIKTEKPKPHSFTHKNCVIAFDLDDTLIEYTPFYKAKVFGYGISLKDPVGSWKYINGLNAMRSLIKKKKASDSQDTANSELLGGGFLQLTYVGIHEKDLRPYIAGLINLIWSNAAFKAGIPQLITYLHEQGYELWIATNKDHVSYTQILESLENRCFFKLSPLIKHSFVVWPSKDMIAKLYTLEPREDSEFQSLVDLIPTIHATNSIHHSHVPKPLKAYYTKMKKYAGEKKIIFFDDKPANIIEAKKYDIHAYRVNNCNGIIQILEKLKILDPVTNREFYEKLNKETIFRKILFWV